MELSPLVSYNPDSARNHQQNKHEKLTPLMDSKEKVVLGRQVSFGASVFDVFNNKIGLKRNESAKLLSPIVRYFHFNV